MILMLIFSGIASVSQGDRGISVEVTVLGCQLNQKSKTLSLAAGNWYERNEWKNDLESLSKARLFLESKCPPPFL